jgi:hypothetical protein
MELLLFTRNSDSALEYDLRNGRILGIFILRLVNQTQIQLRYQTQTQTRNSDSDLELIFRLGYQTLTQTRNKDLY